MQRLLPNIEYHRLGGGSVIVYDNDFIWCAKDGTLIDLTAWWSLGIRAGKLLRRVDRIPRPI